MSNPYVEINVTLQAVIDFYVLFQSIYSRKQRNLKFLKCEAVEIKFVIQSAQEFAI